MRKIMTIIALCLATCTLWAQNEVSLVVSGEGKDKEEATFKALRSAIEQAYGTFVSANTTVLNDQLVAYEIISLSSGNIQKYEYVSENKMPNGNTLVTLSATVSIDKLVSFAESKGMEAELKGGLFAMNIKKMEFDKQAEEKAVENLCKQLEEMLPSIVNYSIEIEDAKLSTESFVKRKTDETMYEIGFRVTPGFSDENARVVDKLIYNTLKKITLCRNEIETYYNIKKPMFGFIFHFAADNKGKAIVLRSKKSVETLFALMNYVHFHFMWFTLTDGSFSFEYTGWDNKFRRPIVNIYPNSNDVNFMVDDCMLSQYFEASCSSFEESEYRPKPKEGNISLYGDDEVLISLYNTCGSFSDDQFDNDDHNFGFGGHWPRTDHFQLDFCSTYGRLFYSLDKLSKITHISVSKPTYFDNDISTESVPQESKNSSQADEEIVQTQSKLPLYNDTLQQAVNEYNTLLKQYPYNYNENRIAYTLSSELPNDDVFLRDTLHTLLKIISEKTAQLLERYKKDSLEFKQMSQSLQDKINEANAQLLNYPYNLQKLTLKDSLSFNLFGKTEELTKELRTKIANLPKMQEQVEREVYEKLIAEDPQRFTEIYFIQNPSKKQEADKSYIECRCKYKERLAFDMAFIHNTLTDCDCREKEYQTVSEFFHSREDFDQMFSQEESAYNMELNNLKSMMADKKVIEGILFNSKQLNFKKALFTSNEELKSIVDRINKHKDKYYYADVIDAVFKLNDKLAKEWEKNGTYFKSKAEMFEYWISEEYDKVLKARKKE